MGIPMAGDWSIAPGAHELHAARRFNNPYFSEGRRSVSRSELFQANELDLKEHADAIAQLHAIMDEFSAKVDSASGVATSGDIVHLIRSAHALVVHALGSGPAFEDIVINARKLIEGGVEDLRALFVDRPEKFLAVQKALASQSQLELKPAIVLQATRHNSAIPQTELLESIMSEDPSSIKAAMSEMPKEIRLAARSLLVETRASGFADPSYHEKLAALD